MRELAFLREKLTLATSMTLVLVLEQRFERTPDGRVWAPGPFLSAVWPRYLKVFSHLRVVARIRHVPEVPHDWQPADGETVTFTAVPYYLGPWQYLLRLPQVASALRRAVGPEEAVILRVPSTIANLLEVYLRRRRHPFGVEVVGDPYEVFAPQVTRHPLRPLLRWWGTRRLCSVCARADAALYVTERALQQRYPCGRYCVTASNVELPDDALRPRPRRFDRDRNGFILATVGTLEQLYKAPDVLIDAVAACLRGHLDVRLIIVGDGKYRRALEERAQRLGAADRIVFRGHLASRAAVQDVLDEADLFVLPSRTEGLPRALIEAMARALPCVGSNVGGMPELLPPEDLFPPGDVMALAGKVTEVLGDPRRWERMSARNLEKAKAYREDILQTRRSDFYAYVREKTLAWQQDDRRPFSASAQPYRHSGGGF
jgi:glycosyltransferase involved in cell wall biosynthesis